MTKAEARKLADRKFDENPHLEAVIVSEMGAIGFYSFDPKHDAHLRAGSFLFRRGERSVAFPSRFADWRREIDEREARERQAERDEREIARIRAECAGVDLQEWTEPRENRTFPVEYFVSVTYAPIPEEGRETFTFSAFDRVSAYRRLWGHITSER